MKRRADKVISEANRGLVGLRVCVPLRHEASLRDI